MDYFLILIAVMYLINEIKPYVKHTSPMKNMFSVNPIFFLIYIGHSNACAKKLFTWVVFFPDYFYNTTTFV